MLHANWISQIKPRKGEHRIRRCYGEPRDTKARDPRNSLGIWSEIQFQLASGLNFQRQDLAQDLVKILHLLHQLAQIFAAHIGVHDIMFAFGGLPAACIGGKGLPPEQSNRTAHQDHSREHKRTYRAATICKFETLHKGIGININSHPNARREAVRANPVAQHFLQRSAAPRVHEKAEAISPAQQ